MIADANEPVMERNINQFRDGILGRKFSPNPMYFHIGFGGGRGFAGLGIGFPSIIGAERFCFMILEKLREKKSDYIPLPLLEL